MKILKLIFLLLFLSSTILGQSGTKIFTSDIDNFWIAYDSVKTTTDTAKQINFIQYLYLDKATSGLKDFMIARQHSARRHLTNILKYPKFWVSLRPHTLQIKYYTTDIETLMVKFKKLYPNFKQPAIYFTIGCLNSGGTTTTNKILIGSEIAASDSTVDASEIGSWLKGVFKLNTSVVYLVAHEVGHTQQKGGDSENDGNSNLLGYCIREGACDFIAELLLEKPILSPYITYGKANEKDLWELFQKDMNKQETKDWLYNGGQAPNGKADLGYFMGYAICKTYYNNSKDKTKALKEIIELNYNRESVFRFLKKSKYKGGKS
ncbi:MAG: DUF2268 domain-containing putative Zn-dependent protease [Chitinophagia bacterium]